jgi:hypothetical protein
MDGWIPTRHATAVVGPQARTVARHLWCSLLTTQSGHRPHPASGMLLQPSSVGLAEKVMLKYGNEALSNPAILGTAQLLC